MESIGYPWKPLVFTAGIHSPFADAFGVSNGPKASAAKLRSKRPVSATPVDRAGGPPEKEEEGRSVDQISG